VTVCLLASLVVTGSASAGPPEYVSSFGPDGTSATGFGRAGSVAVDQGSHLVYVVDITNDSLLRFDLDGTPVPFTGSEPYISGNQLTGLAFPDENYRNQVAVNSTNHRIYVVSGNAVVAFEADGEPAEFSAGPGAGTNEISIFSELRGIAVDSNGAIYTGDFNVFAEGENITVFEPTGALMNKVNTNVLQAGHLAVDTNGSIYMQAAGGGGRVQKIEASDYPATAETTYSKPTVFDPKPSLSVSVDPATNDVYVSETGEVPRIARYSETGVLLSTFAGPGEEGEIERSEGIGIDGASTRVFVSNFPSSGLSQVEIFQPVVGPPAIDRTFVRNVTADSAEIGAEINPNTRDTEYFFEYGLDDCAISSCEQIPASGVPIGDGHNSITVSQQLISLAADTTYHFRVVAENDLGKVEGPDHTFTTQQFGLDLAVGDKRVWEMVSPPNKFGGIMSLPPSGPIQAAEDGNGIAYQTLGSIEGDAEGNRAIEKSSVLAQRGDNGAWASKDLTPAHAKPTPVAQNEYTAFSRNLSIGALEPRDDNPLSESASFKTPYLRLNTEPRTFVPLVTTKEGFANVPPDTQFGEPSEEVRLTGMTPDLDSVVLDSQAPLAAGAEKSSLYRWHEGAVEPASVLPVGEGGAIVAGLFGSGLGSTRNAISEDGSRMFWSRGSYSAAGINTTALYMRNLDFDETVRLDVVQAGATGAGEALPVFQGASADGSVVFFSDTQQLTGDASPEGRDLYRCELSGPNPTECDLTNITAPRVGPGESSGYMGLLPGFSMDGTRAYFVAKGILTAAPNEAGDSAINGQPNLYVWDEESGNHFIATLSPDDSLDWAEIESAANYSHWLSAASSPNGRYFAFMSELSLTGYDNRDSSGGLPAQEVFQFDAADESLRCVSCNPTGSTPRAKRPHADSGFAMVDPQGVWRDRLISGVLPEARLSGVVESEFSAYRPRSVLDNGRVFYNAADSLVPADSNGTWDVYQYEPLGIGSCGGSSASSTFVRSGDGCVGLMSSGTSGQEVGFLDASESGDDVFFLTPAKLSALDTDTVYDVYDARVDGMPAVIDPVVECAGEACQPLVTPPNDPTPASEAFRGPGNQVHCPKGKHKVKRNGKVRCVARKKKKKQHHKKDGKKANKTGRASR